MAAGLLAGAIQGLGGAMQQNAQSTIEQKRQTALEKLRHDKAMERQESQQEFTAGESTKDRGFRAEQSGLDRQQQRELAEMRERGANSRTAMGRNDWQLVPLEGGGYGRYNPRTNQFEEASLPEGAQIGGEGMSDRDKYRLDMLADRANALREKQAEGIEPLTTEEKAQLGRIESQMEAMLGGRDGGGMTPFERLMAGEEGAETDAPREGESPRTTSPRDGDEPSVRGLLSQQIEERRNTQEANEARRSANQASNRADAILERIESEMAGGASPGGLMADINQAAGRGGSISDDTLAEAQQVAEELLSLDQNPNLSSDQKRWIAERLVRLQEAGVPLNLEQ
ncbi:MAG: hypothetical protein ACQEUM_07355 [Pseudomonadota bacterium]